MGLPLFYRLQIDDFEHHQSWRIVAVARRWEVPSHSLQADLPAACRLSQTLGVASMKRLFFTIGSLLVAVCSALLLAAVVVSLWLERPLSNAELVVAVIGAVVVGLVWWRATLRKVGERSSFKQ